MIPFFYCLAVGAGSSVDGLTLRPEEDLWLVVMAYLLLLVCGLAANVAVFFRFDADPEKWRSRVGRLVARPWTWREAGILLASFLAFYLALQLLAGFLPVFFVLDASDANMAGILTGIALYAIGLGLVVWSLFRRKITFSQAFGMCPASAPGGIKRGAVLYLAVLPYVVTASAIFQLFLFLTGRDTGIQDVVRMFFSAESPVESLLFIALAVIGAPLLEEIVFRGITLPLLAKRIGFGAAVVVSSALFAVVHFHFASFAALFVLAIGLSMAYAFSGSLLTPVVMHALFNGVNLGLMFLAYE